MDKVVANIVHHKQRRTFPLCEMELVDRLIMRRLQIDRLYSLTLHWCWTQTCSPSPKLNICGSCCTFEDKTRDLRTGWLDVCSDNLLLGTWHSQVVMAAVTFEELEALVDGEGEVLVLDVRSTEEFSHGRIPFSVCIPLPQIPEAFEMPASAFQQKFGPEKPGIQDQMIVTCR